MKHISFAMTADQIQAGTKTVTRRLGWRNLHAFTELQPIRKGMGLKKGERVEYLRGAIIVVGVRRERLGRMLHEPLYGQIECRLEGFPSWKPHRFVAFFCNGHRGCTIDTIVTRIEFAYTHPINLAADTVKLPIFTTGATHG